MSDGGSRLGENWGLLTSSRGLFMEQIDIAFCRCGAFVGAKK
jgi:hypothetical protein